MPITKQQHQHLTARIEGAKRYAKAKVPQSPDRRWDGDDAIEASAPAEVLAALKAKKAAQKIIDKWWSQEQRRYDLAIRAIDKEANDVSAILLFGDPQKALKRVEEFERKYAPKD